MSEKIRIINIENYVQEIINGELILTPKTTQKSFDEVLINEHSARIMMLEYHYHSLRSEQYEFLVIQNYENEEIRQSLRRQIGKIHLIKLAIKNKFIERFGVKLWDDIQSEYDNNQNSII
jgi:hypothetical protein